MKTLSVATQTHGRVLLRETVNPSAVLVGFHGYMETAEIQMERLQALPGSERWTLISVQGLHRFYKGRSQDTVAGWMTRQDREQMIADNIAYADRAIGAGAAAGVPVFTTGFSQGVALAFRVGIRGARPAAGIISVGGDVPPELFSDTSIEFPPVLICRGQDDEWYTAAKLDADLAALRARGTNVKALVYPGAHEWTDAVAATASDFLATEETRHRRNTASEATEETQKKHSS